MEDCFVFCLVGAIYFAVGLESSLLGCPVESDALAEG